MTYRSSVTSIWTTVLAAVVALLAALGFGGKAAPVAASASVATPMVPAVRRPAPVARRTWRAMMRGGSLPPTIKQRIRAEAHGKSPSVRCSATAAALAADSVRRSGSGSDVGVGVGAGAGVQAGAGLGGGAERRQMALAA
ncbi:DUF6344 domain-containing protein [Streptomyces sp. NPDC048551]|uniref:DUF6344 domain-containing protein n=1 Tax=Streptomyces sp. NPDC048551 TaxID=3155758 RepID=UPI003432FA28